MSAFRFYTLHVFSVLNWLFHESYKKHKDKFCPHWSNRIFVTDVHRVGFQPRLLTDLKKKIIIFKKNLPFLSFQYTPIDWRGQWGRKRIQAEMLLLKTHSTQHPWPHACAPTSSGKATESTWHHTRSDTPAKRTPVLDLKSLNPWGLDINNRKILNSADK